MPVYPGPTANLPAHARRSGRAGTVWEAGQMLGEVVSVEWGVEIEQVAVQIPGTWQDDTKPGAETRRGTFRFQDVHDKWALRVWRFIQARKRGERSAASIPVFDIIVRVDDIGAPAITRWGLYGCQLYQFDGGFSLDDDQLIRDVPFSFRSEEPLDSFEYTPGGVAITRA